MPVDKFGHHEYSSIQTKVDELINDELNVVNVGNKRVMNVGTPVASKDAVTKLYADNLANIASWKTKHINVGNKRIINVKDPQERTDCVTRGYLESTAITTPKTEDGEPITNIYNALGRRISNVGNPAADTDVVTLGYLKQFINNVRQGGGGI